MREGTKKVTTDLVLLVTSTGHYQEFETGAVSDLLLHQEFRPHLSMILPESIVTQVMEAVTDALYKGAVHMVTYTLGLGAKQEYFEAKAIPLHKKHVLLLIQNITEHEENKKALYQKNSLLQTVIDTVPPEITAFDNQGNITIINRAALNREINGSDLMESETLNLKHDGTTEFSEDELPLVRAFRGEAVYDQIVVKKREAYFPRTYLVNAVPLKDEKGGLSGVVLTERDITDIKNIQHKLKSKIKDLDMFMYRASHDLKSPLAAMKGVLELANSKASYPEMKTYLEMLGKSHSLLSTTVNDLISLTRISQKEVEKIHICLNSFIHEIAEALKLLPQAAHIKIKVCVQESIAVEADEGLLRAVLQNLICNAIVHHYREGEDRFVLVTVLNQFKNVLIEVTDNGPGIPKSIQDKIYDMFFRGNLKAGGSGLGLFIVKQAIEKMGATLELVSDEQVGTTFSVIIPNK
ncbi:PAS domain-containing sensor histidine kinase [Pontibacter sp. KCTC 32443]|uniref:sensor histidine kinase n=1 Tax=Pontibacter TaxID=323449 RepID=UPI00164E57B9|nr:MULTISPECIES: PAS domain-containing sensor histidine kinase [Pontibacter]MBC5774629.1 PAS domain-containing sensor histidine kinase [Pontibacter sp. KCTC 32443]